MSQYLRKVIQEVLQQLDDSNLIVKAGTELFHGTGEEFDKNEVRPGGYDSIFWTTDSSLIAQTYIPSSPSKIYTSSEMISLPSTDNTVRDIQKTIGIIYNYSDIEFKNHRAVSYKPASIFAQLYDNYYANREIFFKKSKEFEEFEKNFRNNRIDDIEEREKVYKQYHEMKKELDVLSKQYFDNVIEKKRNTFVNDHLKKLGYEPNRGDSNLNYGWKLKIDKDALQPADYMSPGRLFIVVPKRDLKIYDTTWGGTRDGDLTDVDYHKHNWFETAREKGYDGIRITDFAQSEDQGNFGHLSIGLFRNTLKDVNIEEVTASHQLIGNAYEKKDWHSPEYKNFKQQNP